MISFSDFLVEHVENLSSSEAKEKYVDEVWQILQDSYKYCGGIHGSGFKSKQDMIDNVPFWKLQKKGGKNLTEDEIEKYFVPAEQVETILHKPVKPTGKFTYTREIGGHEHEKMMYGVPGKGFKGK